MRYWPILLALLATTPAPTPAAPATPPKIRALFVGIDKYLYSRTTVESAGFGDLKGAVGDVGRIKAALRTAYTLDLDQPLAGKCTSQNKVSITLTDTCATRDAILTSLQRQIDASAAGDTLIFYYAGHGSQIADDQVFDQASGMNDTILPTDARKPGAESDADILDRELRGYADEATAKGVNIVSIFDSCDSGTGMRGGPINNDPGESRAARPLVAHNLKRPAPPISRGPGGGYRVHLAASADGSVAREVATTADGQRAGVFTTALSQTLIAMPAATFADIMAEVTLRVSEGGRPGQVPQIEGEVTATMGGGRNTTPLFDASPTSDDATLAAGELSGVTTGSTFAFFASASDALANGKPLATGTITAVDAARATAKLDPRAPGTLPARLVARETNHAFGAATLLIRNGARRPEDKAIIANVLASLPFVRVAEPATLAVDPIWFRDNNAYLTTIDGTMVSELGPLGDPAFAKKLHDALQKVMRAQAILALRTRGGGGASPGFCIANDMDYDARRCPQTPTGKPFVLMPGAQAKLAVTNTADVPQHIYVYAIDDAFEVNLLLPSGGGKDPPLLPAMSVSVVVQPDRSGRYRFVTIATAEDAPIASARALEQTGTRDPGACRSTLERLICEAASGTRDPGVSRVGAWVATVTDVTVSEGKRAR